MKKLLSVILGTVMLITTAFCLLACDKAPEDSTGEESTRYVDYTLSNSYEYTYSEDSDLVTYTPVGAEARYGFLFYVGTAIAPEHYAYLAEPLAKQGYLVMISKVTFAYLMYNETSPALTRYPDMEFFIGGHSQGGGAALRRAEENPTRTKGLILYAPLCYNEDSVRESSVPTLLIEATKDGVLTDAMKADAKTRLPDTRTEYMLTGCHMSFSSFDGNATLSMFNDGPATADEKAAQKADTVAHTLAFMNAVAVGG